MILMKFGGTSVQDAAAMSRLVNIVKSRSGDRVVVVSALARVTDSLLRLAEGCAAGDEKLVLQIVDELESRHLGVAKDLSLSDVEWKPVQDLIDDLRRVARALTSLREVSLRSRDRLAAYGELLSSHLVVGAFRKVGTAAQWIDSRTCLQTNSEFTSAKIDWNASLKKTTKAFSAGLSGSSVFVAQGFIAQDEAGVTTTLGRGGSDFSAAILGALLRAEKVEIWTDVNGILSTDPRVVPEAQTIRRIHFTEAAEMAYFGAKVLHPETIYPAVREKIPVWVLNSKNPEDTGTEITFENEENVGVKGLAFKRNVTVVNIHSGRMLGSHGFLKTVFDVFAQHKLSVDLISTSEVSISLTLDPNFDAAALERASAELKEFADIQVRSNHAMVSVIGRGVRNSTGLAAKIFNEIKDIHVQMISMGASELNLSFVVDSAQAEETVKRLHRALISN